MDLNVGDRVSVDGKKVGQARRFGIVQAVNKGLSGARLRVRWDDGTETFFAPSGGNVILERRGRSAGKAKAAAAIKSAKRPNSSKSAGKKATARKPAKASSAKKSSAKKSSAKKSPAKKSPAKKSPAKKSSAKKSSAKKR